MKEVHQCSSCGGFCKKSGCERENDPPLVKFAKTAHLPPLPKTSTFQRFDGAKTVQAHTDAAMREYGALCRRMALEEATVAVNNFGDEYQCVYTTSAICDEIRKLLK